MYRDELELMQQVTGVQLSCGESSFISTPFHGIHSNARYYMTLPFISELGLDTPLALFVGVVLVIIAFTLAFPSKPKVSVDPDSWKSFQCNSFVLEMGVLSNASLNISRSLNVNFSFQ